MREWVERAATGAGVTPAHVAVPALGIASSLIGMARRVRASSSWLEPMTCWVGLVGASGTGKTPGIDAVKRALSQIERDSQSKDRQASVASTNPKLNMPGRRIRRGRRRSKRRSKPGKLLLQCQRA